VAVVKTCFGVNRKALILFVAPAMAAVLTWGFPVVYL
jgi:hypothetical protein